MFSGVYDTKTLLNYIFASVYLYESLDMLTAKYKHENDKNIEYVKLYRSDGEIPW